MTKISVALCTYNGEKFLHQQIDSILKQTVPVNEIIVCDDGSNDQTSKILTQYQAKFPEVFKIHFNTENLRSVKNFEKAISLCSGDIIFLSDQDDIWEENKVEVFMKYFDENPNIDVVCSNGFIIDSKGKHLEKYTVWDAPKFLNEESLPIDFFKIFNTIGNFATGAAMAIRNSLTKKSIPFPEIPGFHHDEWIALFSAQQKKFGFINEKLFSYRLHDDQQVGGISYPKNEASKNRIIQKFNILNHPKTFREFKSKIRTLNEKEKKFNDFLNLHQNNSIEKFLTLVQQEKKKIFNLLKKEKPLYFLFFTYIYK